MSNAMRSGPSRGWWLCLFLAIFLFFVLPPMTASGQSNDRPPTNLSSETLTPLQQATRAHVSALQERKLEVENYQATLQASIKDLTASVASAQTSADRLFQDLTETYAQLSKSETALTRLQKGFADYRTLTEKQIADIQRERDTWKYLTIGAVSVAVVSIIVAAVAK